MRRDLASLIAVLCFAATPALAVTYSDNGDGTVTDPTTGLMWMRNYAGTYTWDQAMALAGTVSFAGHSDWRLPNIRELQSIVDRSKNRPAIDDSAFFVSRQASGMTAVWSASDLGSVPWFVDFYNGIAALARGAGFFSKDSAFQVLLVRTGQSFGSLLNPARPTTDYVDHGNGTVTHTPTGACQ